jgi:uncharacterized protein with HEPN domain
LHQLLVIGEAVKRLSEDFRVAHLHVPWELIAGTRDKLIHHYEDVGVDEVRIMITSDRPALVRLLEPLAPSEC